jgi:hypothetical protein
MKKHSILYAYYSLLNELFPAIFRIGYRRSKYSQVDGDEVMDFERRGFMPARQYHYLWIRSITGRLHRTPLQSERILRKYMFPICATVVLLTSILTKRFHAIRKLSINYSLIM